MRKLLKALQIVAGIYIAICVLLFFFQERLIFFPQKLGKNYKFEFNVKFEEMNIRLKDNKLLNVILFKADSSKGVIYYLHGNAGSISTWGDVAKTYTDLKYDVFMPDYRGYGKSEGTIRSQTEFFEDLQVAYEELETRYPENKIIILGYSVGTGPAAKLASTNHPKMLLLQAPYYSMTDMMHHLYPIIPTFILKYKFETYKYLQDCKMPIVVFHGDEDEVIYYGSSLKLKEAFKQQDTLITLTGQGHNGITENKDYLREIQKLLAR